MPPVMLFDKIITLSVSFYYEIQSDFVFIASFGYKNKPFQVIHSRKFLRSGTLVGNFKIDLKTVYDTSGISTTPNFIITILFLCFFFMLFFYTFYVIHLSCLLCFFISWKGKRFWFFFTLWKMWFIWKDFVDAYKRYGITPKKQETFFTVSNCITWMNVIMWIIYVLGMFT